MSTFKKLFGIAIAIVVLGSTQQALAFSGSGAGTIGDPYMITNCSQFSEISFGLSDNYRLASDIDCSGNAGLGVAGTNDPFTGDFDGAGYTMTIAIDTNGSMYSAPFVAISGATIHDLRVVGSVSATEEYAAGVVGTATGASTIERVVNEASVRGTSYVGGIVAYSEDVSILNSYNTGSISSSDGSYIGGITGFMTANASIINSYNRGQIGRNTDARYHIGGFTGWLTPGSIITNSFNSGAVLSGQSTFFFGGLWGNDQGGSNGNSSATLTNNFFDISRSTRTMCGYDNGGQAINPVAGQCEGVNAGNSSIHYFKDTDTNEPLASWDFATIWETDTDEYPSLRAIANDGGVVNDDPDVIAPIISEVTPVTTPTREYTQSYTFTTDEEGTILFGGSCSMSDGIATVGSNTIEFNLDPGTYSDCTIQVRDAGNNTSNTINVTSFIVDRSFLGEGDGTENTPYLVTTCEELQSLDYNVDDGVYVALSNNIDCSATATWNEDPGNPGQYFGFQPIRNFNGTFFGGGYTISGLTIHRDSSSNVGLFTEIGWDALVYGLSLTGIDVSGGDNHAGGLAGSVYGAVVGVHVEGEISSAAGRVGGFAGLIQSDGGVSKSSFVGVVGGGVTSSGGFTGYAVNTTISDSYARAAVGGGSNATGGFVGETSSCCTYLYRNYATGSVTASGGNVGGFVGYATAGDVIYQDNFASNTVSGGDTRGAFIGLEDGDVTITGNYYDSTSNGSDDCIASGGDINDECTGVAGPEYFYLSVSLPLSNWNFTTVWQEEDGDYPTLVPVTELTTPGVPQNVSVQTDGLNPVITWDTPSVDGGIPVNRYSIQMKRTDDAWTDPLVIDATSGDTIYDSSNDDLEYGTSYDVRIAARNFVGYGEYSDAVTITSGQSTIHEISSCQELQDMDNDAETYTDTFNLTQNIDCSGIPEFIPLGSDGNWNSNFRGTFDGNGYTISNLTISRPESGNVGLFSEIDRATIKNLTLRSGSVVGVYSVGSVAGYAYHSTIRNVHSDLDVTGQFNSDWGWGGSSVGGVVGEFYTDGDTLHNSSISNSSSSGAVKGQERVGGILGYSEMYPSNEDFHFEFSLTNNLFTGSVDRGDSNQFSYRFGGLLGELELDNDNEDGASMAVTISGNTVTSNLIETEGSAGGLIGYVESYFDYDDSTNTIVINENHIDATVSNRGAAGGLIGSFENYNETDGNVTNLTIQGNSIEGSVTADEGAAGGLIGEFYSEMYNDAVIDYVVTENRNLADVTGYYAGGLFGNLENYLYDDATAEEDSLTQNYVEATITATNAEAGGLVGYLNVSGHVMSLGNSYVTGTVTGPSHTGGLIGAMSGEVEITRSYASGSVGSTTTGGSGGLVGNLYDNGSLDISNSFAANAVSGNEAIGSILGYVDAGLYTFSMVQYDDSLNDSLGCVNNGSAAGCALVYTPPDAFKNNSSQDIFSTGTHIWDFEDVWNTSPEYPLLRTTFVQSDVTPPILTEVTPIAAQTTIANAVYRFTSSESCTIYAQPVYASLGDNVQLLISDIEDGESNETAVIDGIRVGGTYSFAFNCEDENGNSSNTISSGQFTVIADAVTPTPQRRTTRTTSLQSRIRNLELFGNTAAADKLKAQHQNSSQGDASQGQCPADQVLSQNLRSGSRNGRYHPYTKAIVAEADRLQAHLNRLGFNSGPVDGILGPISDGAIKRMQTYLGTFADGYVGPITRGLLNKSCGAEGLKKS
jgi:hypothetical protein